MQPERSLRSWRSGGSCGIIWRGQISDRLSHQAPIAIPFGMDTEIPKAGTEGQNSRPRQGIVIRGMQDQPMVDKRDEHRRGSYSIIQMNPRDSVSEVVQILKGGTSRVIRKEFPDLEEFLWGDSFWADGYFAETIGKVDEEIVRKYIREQQG